MTQTQNNATNNRYSFYGLLANNKVVVPIIQRDYAQGRNNDKAEEVRTEFLDSLFIYLSDGESHDLDFVYGTIENSTPKKSFIPLDGQQRLTTLFLLHWYLMQQMMHKEKDNSYAQKIYGVLKDQNSLVSKSMFSYRTRQSSSDFCDKLVDVRLDFEQLLDKEVYQENGKKTKVPSVAETIRNYNWFATKWNYDPTVQSMLTMLDAIHEKFGQADHGQFLERLLDPNNPAIAFVYMDLDEYKLSDELYIQMNSRGKPLTPFENFKAKFEQYVGDIMETDPAKKKKEYKGLDVSVLDEIKQSVESNCKQGQSTIDSVKKYFSFNIDTKWTNLFWAYCIEELNNPEIENKQDNLEKVLTGILDKKMANFIRVILTFQYAVEGSDPKAVIGGVLQNEKNAYISFSQYEKNKILSPGSVEYLISAFDILSNKNQKINVKCSSSKYFNEEEVFESIINHGLIEVNYAELIRFHAYLRYLIYFGKAQNYLDEWMRFVYNLSELTNTRTDDPSRFAAAIKSISKILDDMKNAKESHILKFLDGQDNDFKMSHFSSWQVKEEVIKAHLMQRSTDSFNWKDEILKLERHGYFNGQIGFILEFSGIVEYFTQNNNFIGWSNAEEQKYYDDFVKNGKIASELFKYNYENRELAKESLLERAAMTVDWKYMLGYHGANSQYPVNDCHAYLLCTTESSMQRDFSWRKVLHIDTNDAFRHQPIKDLFSKIDENNVEISVQDIINKAKSSKPINQLSWVDAFVRYPANMKKCRYGIVHFADNRCILFHGVKYSKNDAELFTYTIWEKEIKSTPITNKFELSYKFANFTQEWCYPHIMCKFTFGDQDYAIRIMTVANNWDFKNYEFLFGDIDNQNMQISPILTNVLISLGFSQSKPGNPWTCISNATTYDDSNTVKTELENILNNLSNVI